MSVSLIYSISLLICSLLTLTINMQQLRILKRTTLQMLLAFNDCVKSIKKKVNYDLKTYQIG